MNNEEGRNLRAIVSAFDRRQRQLLRALCVAVLGVLALVPTGARADPSLQVMGATIGEWSAEWWKWLLKIPADRNPLTDSVGTFCAEGQRGPVWFLAGSWLAPPVGPIACTIPRGKSILFPIANMVWVQTGTYHDDPTNTETDYRECVSGFPGNALGCPEFIPAVAGDLEATLDGVPVVFDYRTPIVRTQSPLFIVKWKTGNIFGVDPALETCAKCGQAVSDGFWVMLPALKRGEYVLRFRAGDGANDLQDITYHLTVR